MKKNHKQILAEALNDIRYEAIDPSAVKNAAERVWARVANEENIMATTQTAQAEHLRNCDDFQSLIPAYVSQQLTSARVMLFEDHTRECFACRNRHIYGHGYGAKRLYAYGKHTSFRQSFAVCKRRSRHNGL